MSFNFCISVCSLSIWSFKSSISLCNWAFSFSSLLYLLPLRREFTPFSTLVAVFAAEFFSSSVFASALMWARSFLRQELTFLAVRADMKLCKGITEDLAVIVRSHHDSLQPHAALPDCAACQSSLHAEAGGEVLDEVWSQLQHRHV